MTKVDRKTFDFVHGTQVIFRGLVDCMSRPGSIVNISESISMIDESHGLTPGLTGLAFTLLDREVSFNIISEQIGEATQYIKWNTYSNVKPLEEADYIFIQNPPSKLGIHSFMNEVKLGTLEDPHASATLLFHVDSINKEGNLGLKLQLSGPGIKETSTVYIEGLQAEWLKARKEMNKEFPIGVDIILVTANGELLAIPRTTMIESECVQWDM